MDWFEKVEFYHTKMVSSGLVHSSSFTRLPLGAFSNSQDHITQSLILVHSRSLDLPECNVTSN